MKPNQISALRTTGLITLGCLAAFIVHCIQMLLLGDGNGNISMSNPLISGFLHASPSHFITNIVIIGLCLLPAVNQGYDIKKIFWITTLLSILYLPISIMGITQPAVGLSGTWFFLASRFFFSWKSKALLGKGIIIFLALAELNSLFLPSDGVAHVMHLLGIGLGFLSLHKDKVFSIFPYWLALKIA